MVSLYFGSAAALLGLYAHTLGLNFTATAVIGALAALIITIHYNLDDLLYSRHDPRNP